MFWLLDGCYSSHFLNKCLLGFRRGVPGQVTFKPPGLKEQRALHLQTLVNEYNPVVKQDLIQPLTLLDQ